MKKAVVVGGSNGIGLAIVGELISRGYHVLILDIAEPDDIADSDSSSYTYIKCNLLDFDEAVFESLKEDKDIDFLMITAGFGRAAAFEHIHTAEIKNIFEVNTVAAVRIIRYFYERIRASERFYCGVMGSIAGLMSSPLFSVYSASKSALCRFIESVNIELEVFGTSNRILNVSPASIRGTKFNGGENDIEQIRSLAGEIVTRAFDSEELFIPNYDETFKAVLQRYHDDPHEYGLHSYDYKIKSGRVTDRCKASIGYLSGTFDLFHVGHLNLLRRAKEQCDYLIVGVHPSAAHKGKEAFIPFEERMEIVKACKYVDKVIPSLPEDSDVWQLYHYTKLFVGSDYKGTERFNRYEEYFKDKGVDIVYFPYTKGTSSTQLRKSLQNNIQTPENEKEKKNITHVDLNGKVILVTGAAGFIGAYLVKRLLSDVPTARIIGIDSVNDYYDVRLKEYRLKGLSENENFTFVRGNIADKGLICDIFDKYRPSVVVNLAAQAGVRYSITNPDVYVESNLIGFFNILEACRRYPVEHLVYASSSSVYGSNKKVPYSTDDKVDNPVSLYAATKKSNELMAHAYSKLYNIPSTGLRFFTVYGPAGRPDMAYFGFTNKLVAGETIKIFNYGNCKRDFTYIDDIVEGIVRVMQGAPEKKNGDDGLPIPPYAVYNIGNNHPENLLDFVRILSEELVRAGVLPEEYDFEAHKELVPMQAGDVPVTYADTDALERDHGFKPSTSLREGLRNFAEWYKKFYI